MDDKIRDDILAKRSLISSRSIYLFLVIAVEYALAAQWRAWIERRVEKNVGWDKIVAGIVLAAVALTLRRLILRRGLRSG